jgi:hypothetical protein
MGLSMYQIGKTALAYASSDGEISKNSFLRYVTKPTLDVHEKFLFYIIFSTYPTTPALLSMLTLMRRWDNI